MSAYHEGIDARKKKIGRHENPYDRSLEFIEYLFNPMMNMYELKTEWDRGWDAENEYQSVSVPLAGNKPNEQE